jgi:hypothetical protein
MIANFETLASNWEPAILDAAAMAPLINPTSFRGFGSISHETFEGPNREVARIVARYPGRFIGYAKHDPVNEKGRIRSMLLQECRGIARAETACHADSRWGFLCRDGSP